MSIGCLLVNRKTLKFEHLSSMLGSGCGTVGRVVASDTRDPWFESQHWQKFICQLFYLEKTKIMKQRPG